MVHSYFNVNGFYLATMVTNTASEGRGVILTRTSSPKRFSRSKDTLYASTQNCFLICSYFTIQQLGFYPEISSTARANVFRGGINSHKQLHSGKSKKECNIYIVITYLAMTAF